MKTFLTLSFCLYFLINLAGCRPNSNCVIKLNGKFEGDGILVLEDNYSEDGFTNVTFFPVCQIDTINLLASLQQGGKGISFSAYHNDVVNAIRKRTVVLTSTNEKRSLANRKVYLTSVHLSFSDTVKKARTYSNLNSTHVLDTKQVRFKQQVFNVNDLYVTKLYGI